MSDMTCTDVCSCHHVVMLCEASESKSLFMHAHQVQHIIWRWPSNITVTLVFALVDKEGQSWQL